MKLTLPLIILILSGTVFSTGMIRGYVRNAEGIPLPEANITIIATTLGGASDEEGKYVIRSVKPGTYILKCSHVSYRDGIQRGVKVEKDKFTDIDFVLSPLEYILKPIEAKGYQEDYNSLLYTRNLIIPRVFETYEAPPPVTGLRVTANTKVGFWEKFRHFFRKTS